MPEPNPDVAVGEEAAAEKAEHASEYVTKADIAGLKEQIEGLVANMQTKSSDEVKDILDNDAVQRAYDELYTQVQERPAQEGEEAPDEDAAWKQQMTKKFDLVVAALQEQHNARMRDVINAKGRAKYDDWDEHETELWKFAAQPEYRNLKSIDDVYVLWKYRTQGKESLTPTEQRKVAGAMERQKEAGETAKEAKAAASEKPGAESAGKEREFSSLGELLRETYNKMPAKPVFH